MLPAIIQKLVPRFASEFEGEVIATRNAIGQALRSAGLDWNDLAVAYFPASPGPYRNASIPAPQFFTMARACRDLDRGSLNNWERGFVADMCRYVRASPSPKQVENLTRIFLRLQRRAA